MLHGVKKVKFRKGQDANQALMQGLMADFVRHEHIETTLQRAKALKSMIDRLTSRAKKQTEAHRNILLSTLRDKVLVEKLFSISSERFSTREGGYVRLIRLGTRQGDGAEIARVEWVEGEKKKETPKEATKEIEKAQKTQETKPKVEKKKAESAKEKVAAPKKKTVANKAAVKKASEAKT